MTGLDRSRAVAPAQSFNSPLRRMLSISVAVGLLSFMITEFMHFLLVPDLGHRWERWLAEGVSAAVVAMLTARLMQSENQVRQAALLRMQVISEMNHHIRNALATISYSSESIENQQNMQLIAESVDRIEWALREILLRPKPLPDQEAKVLYFSSHAVRERRGP